MRTSVVGLGYAGCVSAACTARDGHYMVGRDVNPQKVALLSFWPSLGGCFQGSLGKQKRAYLRSFSPQFACPLLSRQECICLIGPRFLRIGG